ncbi:putative carboxylesterase [Abeliophyllum distichum]|uniref:Carboxylesterase n=1 Tax=Abeliophyllum distichum TaxID=126358 RepID=A0ABD1SU55_9LAMI
MASSNNEIEYEFLPLIRVYKNGHVERLIGTDSIPAGTDSQTGVSSKDVTNIIPETEVYVRIYLPNLRNKNKKIPLLVYVHGGGFVSKFNQWPLNFSPVTT